MDLKANNEFYEALVSYNSKLEENYGNEILRVAPLEPKYPYTLFRNIRNTGDKNYNSIYGKMSSVGYSISIYAQDIGELLRVDIAEHLAEELDKFFAQFDLERISFTPSDLERDGSTFNITITYLGNFDEYRRKFI